METQKNTYSRREYINNYKLTEAEYKLLPVSARMEYCAHQVGDLLSHIDTVGQKICIDESLPQYIYEYFEYNGCSVECQKNPDSQIPMTQITRISDTHYPRSAHVEHRLNQHLYELAMAKAKLFEELYKGKLDMQKNYLDMGIELPLDIESPSSLLNRITNLPVEDLNFFKDNIEYLIEYELKMLMEELEENYVTIKRPHELYIEFLKGKGYRISMDDDNISIYKPVKEAPAKRPRGFKFH